MKDPNIQTIVDNMLSELSGITRASENTLQAYKNDLNDFIKYCKNRKIEHLDFITEKSIRLYIMQLNEQRLAKSSVSRKLSALRRMFNYALRNDLIDNNPLSKISNPKTQRSLPETINLDSFEEIYRLIDEKIENQSERKRNKAIFELLYGCALRVSELCSLNIGDVDLIKQNVRILGKGAKVRIVPIGQKSIQIINDYLEYYNKLPYSHPMFFDKKYNRIDRHKVYKLVRKFLSSFELKKRSPHILRHSAATHMLDNDADLMAVKEILGHENLSTTQIYTHVSIERLKKTYKQAHPKSKKESI